ncbi:MAG TPA: hypothetical protein VI603_14065 [Saprospiraceae bacterium]|nr:hypothetical protein [Saprospiraceae bacterium]
MYRMSAILILGFLLFLFGFIALVLMLVGLQLSFLAFIDSWGRTVGLVIRLLMVFGGVVVVFLARSKFEK